MLLDDFDQATSARFPRSRWSSSLVTFLVLLVVFRAPVLALVAVLLNLVTVGRGGRRADLSSRATRRCSAAPAISTRSR